MFEATIAEILAAFRYRLNPYPFSTEFPTSTPSFSHIKIPQTPKHTNIQTSPISSPPASNPHSPLLVDPIHTTTERETLVVTNFVSKTCLVDLVASNSTQP